MIYVTFRQSKFDNSQTIKNVWNLDIENVEELYKAFMQKHAEVMNIKINPHWLNIMNYQDHNNHLSELEYCTKCGLWQNKLEKMNIDNFISEILNGKKEDVVQLYRF